ncbi:hypothetical protein [Castellaniella sp.]|uniref:hypothetical protein n=1 Tax=Castellaniella sp. TaxID=1955812 RepID=UPI002AFF278C|nr:hypothetical protein [Castellaniella sp.]
MSAEIIDINTGHDERISVLWRDFVAAQTRAQASLQMADGMAAGAAWRRFLMAYETPEQRRASVSFLNAGGR